jgi:hypothetical protein
MKIDPGMHVGLHLVFFGKTGVTSVEVDSLEYFEVVISSEIPTILRLPTSNLQNPTS